MLIPIHIPSYSMYFVKYFYYRQIRIMEFHQPPTYQPDDGGHDVSDNFEFPCNSVKNLISIWNFTNTVMKNVKKNMRISNPLRWDIIPHTVKEIGYLRGTNPVTQQVRPDDAAREYLSGRHENRDEDTKTNFLCIYCNIFMSCMYCYYCFYSFLSCTFL